jgi:hypothetical protein
MTHSNTTPSEFADLQAIKMRRNGTRVTRLLNSFLPSVTYILMSFLFTQPQEPIYHLFPILPPPDSHSYYSSPLHNSVQFRMSQLQLHLTSLLTLHTYNIYSLHHKLAPTSSIFTRSSSGVSFLRSGKMKRGDEGYKRYPTSLSLSLSLCLSVCAEKFYLSHLNPALAWPSWRTHYVDLQFILLSSDLFMIFLNSDHRWWWWCTWELHVFR